MASAIRRADGTYRSAWGGSMDPLPALKPGEHIVEVPDSNVLTTPDPAPATPLQVALDAVLADPAPDPAKLKVFLVELKHILVPKPGP